VPFADAQRSCVTIPMLKPSTDTAATSRLPARDVSGNSAFICRRALALVGIGLASFVLVLECYQYLLCGAYLDHVEGDVLISGWQYFHGEPLYLMQDGAPRFATFYGPLTYLVEVPALILLGASVTVSKLTSMLALLVTVSIISAHFVRHPSAGDARYAIFFLLAALLLFSPVSFWVRSDPIETLLVAIAVRSTASHRGPLWVGICMGLAANLKVHAFLYFLPLLADLWWSSGRRAPLVAIGTAVATFIWPFLGPRISFGDYLRGLAQQIGTRGQTWSHIWPVSTYLSLLLFPVAIPLVTQRQQRRTKIYAAATLSTALLLLYPATAQGCGTYHFLPLVPVIADLCWRLQPKGISAELTPVAILVVACLGASQILQELATDRGSDLVSAEALALARHSTVQPVQIGYGDNLQSYQLSQLSRTVLAVNSYPALIDAHVLMELHQVGVDGSTRWVTYLTQCGIRRWLLPKGERPFAIDSYFYDNEPLFSQRFRQAFFDHYKLVEQTRYFAIWDCIPDRQSSGTVG
jgi:Glycosyltransferase family 87